MRNKPVIGVIGGGQLGRMFIEEALRYNIECVIVDADEKCPASVIAHDQIVGSIAEAGPIRRLGRYSNLRDRAHLYKAIARIGAGRKKADSFARDPSDCAG